MTASSLENRLRRWRRAPLVTIANRLRIVGRQIADLPHEVRLGIRTSKISWKFVDRDKQNLACDPVPYRTLAAIARHMTARGIAAPRFADLGSGLGRPLYFFAPLFDELQGYELIGPIHDMAAAELARVRGTRPAYARITLTCADATAVALDRPQILFLYNPFGPKPMARLCERLRAAHGELHIYYVNPQPCADMIASALGPPEMFHCGFPIAYFHLPGVRNGLSSG